MRDVISIKSLLLDKCLGKIVKKRTVEAIKYMNFDKRNITP